VYRNPAIPPELETRQPAAEGEGLQTSTVLAFVDMIAFGLQLAAVTVIVGAVLAATGLFLRQGLLGHDWRIAYAHYRANLGRGILIGLELLVGADIIATITAPLTFTSVGLLGLIILIRTFLSFALETEIEGRWPWRRAATREAEPSSPPSR